MKIRTSSFLVFLVIVLLVFLFSFLYYNTLSRKKDLTYKTEQYLTSIRNNPRLVYAFFRKMPKGADLHMHIGGSEYAENFIHYGAIGKFCLNRTNMTVFKNKNCPYRNTLLYTDKDNKLYRKLIDSWSMKDFKPSKKESSAVHFFSTFKTDPILNKYYGDVLSDIVVNVADNNISYIELQTTIDDEKISALVKDIHWNNNLRNLYKSILKKNLTGIEKDILKKTIEAEKVKKNKLFCRRGSHNVGCNVLIRWQHATIRTLNPISVFAQLIMSFDLAKNYPNHFVGINLLGPENNHISLRDYHKQMVMIRFLHKKYPNVKISLHAGELISDGVSSHDLSFHIKDAIDTAKASRIGHGLDIKHEKGYKSILHKMAQDGIAVEISPTSEEVLWNVIGKNHPFMTYMNYNVPIVISTDDLGTLRTNITEEYKKIFYRYHLNYREIKSLVRDGLSYSFLPGENLWGNLKTHEPQQACLSTKLGSPFPPRKCTEFLNRSPKAEAQWQLERQLNKFENRYAN